MDAARTVLEGAPAPILLGSGGSKLARAKPVVANFARMGIGLVLLPILGTIELALAGGLLIGFGVPIIGAVSVHLALRDARTGPVPAVVLGTLALVLTLLNIPHLDQLFR